MRWRLFSATLLKAGLLAALVSCETDRVVEPASDCLVKASDRNGQVVAGSYIVTYKPDEALPAAPNARVGAVVERFLAKNKVADTDADVLFSGNHTAFVAHLSQAESERLRQDPAVEMVEPDRIVSMCSCVDVVTPTAIPWNIQFTGYGRGDYKDQLTKTVWVIDTGIDLDHPDLNVDKDRSVSFITGKTPDDENGHGTHVAGIIGALNNNIGVLGIASGAKLVSLRVLDQVGEGRLSGIISAVSHVARNGKAGDVVNMSLGGEGTSATLERQIQLAADKGILFAIAAGNEGEAIKSSPARFNHPNVFTVSAMDRSENFASFSNYGPEVDVCAFGVRVQSTYKDGRYATLSGTSMAAPHIAGLLLIRGTKIPKRGFVKNDPDGQADPIAGE
ncbi:hypothetical protein GCM10023187_44280 [Nibrella viscosa]|uniref:Peptidase inhibitor I9 n=1 Tax=Nibrella viscosa TaxID=1084524 RepID=A0ABP8KT96_9BACT